MSGDKPKFFHFDGTISVANIASIGAVLITAVIAFNTHDKRITVLEEFRINQKQRDDEQDRQIRERLDELKNGQRDLTREVRELNNLILSRQAARPAPQQGPSR